MNYLKTLLLSLLAISLFGCRSQYDAILASSDLNAKYKAAFNYFNKKKYDKAATLFQSMALLTTNTSKDDTVRFYTALSNFKDQDYAAAQTAFSQFVALYPNSTFTEEARFLRLRCLYKSTYRYQLDPRPSYACLNAIAEFIKDYPNSKDLEECYKMQKNLNDRLDKKAFMSAYLYYKMEDYKAANVAFHNILKDDPDNIYRADVLYYIALSAYKYADLSIVSKQKERFLAFIDDYFNFIAEEAKSPHREELDKLYASAKEILASLKKADKAAKK